LIPISGANSDIGTKVIPPLMSIGITASMWKDMLTKNSYTLNCTALSTAITKSSQNMPIAIRILLSRKRLSCDFILPRGEAIASALTWCGEAIPVSVAPQ
jgi:hypothetical protein